MKDSSRAKNSFNKLKNKINDRVKLEDIFNKILTLTDTSVNYIHVSFCLGFKSV